MLVNKRISSTLAFVLTFSFSLTLVVIPTANAIAGEGGGGPGNGGQVVVCYNKDVRSDGRPASGAAIQSVEFADHWEFSNRLQLKLALGDANLTPKEKVRLVADRMRDIDSRISDVLDSAYDRNFDKIALTTSPINEIYDANLRTKLKLDKNCTIDQIAGHWQNVKPGEYPILIYQRYYNRLANNDQKAMVYLHELLWPLFISENDKRTKKLPQ